MLRSLLTLLLLCLSAPALAADPCPLLRAQVAAPAVATRIAVVACDEHQQWYRPFIDVDGHLNGSRVREAEGALLANGQPAWQRVAAYWRDSGLLGSASGRPGASDCAYATGGFGSPNCRAFVVDVPWSAAWVSYVMRRAQVPGFDGSASHVSYVRRAYRTPEASAYQVASPASTRPAPGDMLCYVRVSGRVFGFGGLANLLAGGDDGLNMHCDIVTAVNPNGDRRAYLVGGNVLDGVTMRVLKLTPGGQFDDLPMRGAADAECTPDAPLNCNASRQDWAVLLQLKAPELLAKLPPAPPLMPVPGAPMTPQQPQCCVNCVVGSGIPRCPAIMPSPGAVPVPPGR